MYVLTVEASVFRFPVRVGMYVLTVEASVFRFPVRVGMYVLTVEASVLRFPCKSCYLCVDSGGKCVKIPV